MSANHNSYFDIPLLGCALSRRADNIAKRELFNNRIVSAFFRSLGGFPIKRGQADHGAIREAVKRLRAGHLLSFYPEGTRSRDGRLQKGKPGVGMIVAESGVLVVPAFIQGTAPVRIFRQVTICFGKPIDFSEQIINARKEGMNQKILYGTISAGIMVGIALLQRGLVNEKSVSGE